MAKQNQKDLEALRKLENPVENQSTDNFEVEVEDNKPNILDGYKIIERYNLPQDGNLYPESWEFAYRCPVAKEVANFSTLQEGDNPAIVAACEDLIRKCVIIFDTEKNRQVSSGQICDAHRTFFLLLLRDFYLPGNPIKYPSVCRHCTEPMEINLTANKLKYTRLSDKLINAFDGRSFSLVMPEIEEPINFLVPSVEVSSRIFKYIVKVYRDSQNDAKNHENKEENKNIYDKQFLLLAPYLYVRGNETVKEIIQKFKQIQKDEKLFKAYIDIAVKLKLDNLDYIENTCDKCGSEEEALLRFPGGWKAMFISAEDNTGYFN